MNKKEKKLYDNTTERIGHTHSIAKAIFDDIERESTLIIGINSMENYYKLWLKNFEKLKKKWLE